MFPYLDVPGFARRSAMPQADVYEFEAREPGYIAQCIKERSSWINGRLRKRYGRQGNRSSLPFGQSAPPVDASGTAPPEVTLSGRPVLGSMEVVLQVATPGGLGTALFQWSSDGGLTWTGTNVPTASTVVLGATGLTANFANGPGPYGTDNTYVADTPVPVVVIGWLVRLVTFDVYRRRGMNPQDPAIALAVKDIETVQAEVKEAADSKDGLFDLPTTDEGDTAITSGGPMGCSDASPYAWQDRQARRGYAQDARQLGAIVPGIIEP